MNGKTVITPEGEPKSVNAVCTMRVARPTDNIAEIAEMYAKGLGLKVLATFDDHVGFDGVILGHPLASYLLEFTSERGHHAGAADSQIRYTHPGAG